MVLSGCASNNFAFKYYALDAKDYEGYLRGPTAKDDINLQVCQPVDDKKTMCVILLVDDFLSLKKEYLEMRNNLNMCQSK